MAWKIRSFETTRLLALMLVISLPFTQLLQVHFHVYDHQHGDHQHGFSGSEGHQVISHSDLEQSVPPHHQDAVIIETAQPFFAKILKFQAGSGFVFLVCLLFLLVLLSGTVRTLPGPDLLWKQRFRRPVSARAPPLH